MNNFQDRIEETIRKFKNKDNVIIQIIILNVLVFVIIGFIKFGYAIIGGFNGTEDMLKNSSFRYVWNFLALPDTGIELLKKPWTLLTYMFMHADFGHIFWNMILLYFFGNLMREFQGNRKVLTTYLLGGFAGGILFIMASNSIPLMKGQSYSLVGASAGLSAVMAAIAFLIPNYIVNIYGLIRVKLIYVAGVFILLNFVNFSEGANYGGKISHIGGIFYGLAWAWQMKNGIDINLWFDKLLYSIPLIFKRQPKRPKKQNFKTFSGGKKSTAGKSENFRKDSTNSKDNQKEIDIILDKISKSGYESLSEKEKDILFNASKKS